MGKEITNEYELVVSQGRRPFWMIILAAIAFTLTIYELYYLFLMFYKLGFNKETFKIFAHSLGSVGFFFATGVANCITKTVLIDTDNDKLISRFCVGPFSRDVLTEVPQLEYIAVFFNAKEVYEVNLWYVGNKHYQMYGFEKKSAAMKFAQLAATKLNIDLLDATVKGNSKWIDKTAV